MEPIRAFIAVELPDSVKAAISSIQVGIRCDEHSSVKWVNPDSVHLTLKFLGNIKPELVPDIGRAMSQAAAGLGPLRLELSELGGFPNLRAPRVVWLGLGGDISTLRLLYRQLEHGLAELGFPPEGRAFSPHLTLGRVRQGVARPEQQRLAQAITSAKLDERAPFEAHSVALMRSTLTRAGAIYSRILEASL
jgi:RNA 2',3'-cyclic 3'-phosphodiesterase